MSSFTLKKHKLAAMTEFIHFFIQMDFLKRMLPAPSPPLRPPHTQTKQETNTRNESFDDGFRLGLLFNSNGFLPSW